MKKILIVLTVALAAVAANAHGHHHHHHGGWWGRGGRNFWPGFVGGVVGGALVGGCHGYGYYGNTTYVLNATPYVAPIVTPGVTYIQPTTTVVQPTTTVVQPATTVVQPQVAAAPAVAPAPVTATVPAPTVRQPVWVYGQYVDQVDANGVTVRVWVPGHYE